VDRFGLCHNMNKMLGVVPCFVVKGGGGGLLDS
jgi:hypothetical protein